MEQTGGTGPEIFTPENAAVYGEWLGRRYREKSLIWILGGDRPVENDLHRAILRAMAAGLRQGDGGAHLITFHPTGGSGSAEVLHGEPWLDFNMRQNGHTIDFNPSYAKHVSRLPAHSGQTRDRRRTHLRGPPGRFQSGRLRPFPRRRCPAPPLLESLPGSLWPHLWQPLHLANVQPGPARLEQPPHGRGARPSNNPAAAR